MWHGLQCIGGINTVINSTVYDATSGLAIGGSCWIDTDNKYGAPVDSQCDTCDIDCGAHLPVIAYITCNYFFTLFFILVIKSGSASLLWIILTVRLPLVQIAFAIPPINAPPDTFQQTSIIGLFVIIGGLACYRYAANEDENYNNSDIEAGTAAIDAEDTRLANVNGDVEEATKIKG